MGQCLGRRERSQNSDRSHGHLFLAITEEESPLETAMRIMYQAIDNDLSGHTRMLRNSDGDLRGMLEYLQNCLPLDDPIMGSVACIIVRESALPSPIFLRQVDKVLRLDQLALALMPPLPPSPPPANPDSLESSQLPSSDLIVIASTPAMGGVDTATQQPPSAKKKKRKKTSTGGGGAGSAALQSVNSEEGYEMTQARNSCLVLDCLATRLCGPNATFLLNDAIMHFLTACIQLRNKDVATQRTCPARLQVVLHGLLAFEKFAQTRQCQAQIEAMFNKLVGGCPIVAYESWADSPDLLRRQIGFCAVWMLDNVFTVLGREYAYLQVDGTDLNAVLNIRDVSQYLKISPNGLEARCDSDFFESVRCTYEVISGTFYYEVTLITAGIMQIGWATKDSPYLNHEGRGIGDDPYSVAYDGFRQHIWHDATPDRETGGGKWKPNDVIGCLLSVDKEVVIFYVNGKALKKRTDIFHFAKRGFFAAASFLCNQQCVFNFGRTPFVFPPKNWAFKSFNQCGQLTETERLILPRSLQLELVKEESFPDNACTLCLTNPGIAEIHPCKHTGFCRECAIRLTDCPLCRGHIDAVSEPPDPVVAV